MNVPFFKFVNIHTVRTTRIAPMTKLKYLNMYLREVQMYLQSILKITLDVASRYRRPPPLATQAAQASLARLRGRVAGADDPQVVLHQRQVADLSAQSQSLMCGGSIRGPDVGILVVSLYTYMLYLEYQGMHPLSRARVNTLYKGYSVKKSARFLSDSVFRV